MNVQICFKFIHSFNSRCIWADTSRLSMDCPLRQAAVSGKSTGVNRHKTPSVHVVTQSGQVRAVKLNALAQGAV
jgi:hypothetical protein